MLVHELSVLCEVRFQALVLFAQAEERSDLIAFFGKRPFANFIQLATICRDFPIFDDVCQVMS